MPEEQENNRNPDGTFKPGVSGNPGGRPVGSVSIVGMIRRKFEENPEYALEWVDQLLADPSNRKAVMEQIDGKPRQTADITSGGAPIISLTDGDRQAITELRDILKQRAA